MRRVWIAGLMAVGILIGGAANVTARQSGPAPFRGTVRVVRAGDTLWEIVRGEYPGEDPREQIVRVRKANRMRSSTIVPGQRLRLPAP